MRHLLAAMLVLLVGITDPLRATAEPAPSPGQGAETGSDLSLDEALRILWAQARTHIDRGEPRAALPLLTALVARAPHVPLFRSALADALAATGQTDRARYHYDLLRGAMRSDRDQAALDRRIDALERRQKPWSGHLFVGVVPASNPGRRTDLTTVTIAGLPFQLRDTARSGVGVELRGGLAWEPWLRDDLRGHLGVSVDAELYGSGIADDITLRGDARITAFGDRAQQLSFGIFAKRRWRGGEKWSDSLGAEIGLSRRVGESTLLSGRLIHETEQLSRGRAAVHRNTAELRARHIVSPQFQLRGTLRGEWRDSSNPFLSGFRSTLRGGGAYTFEGGLRVGLDITREINRFDGVNPVFGVRQRNNVWRGEVTLNHAEVSLMGFSPVVKLDLTRQRSTIPTSSFTNRALSLGLTRQF